MDESSPEADNAQSARAPARALRSEEPVPIVAADPPGAGVQFEEADRAARRVRVVSRDELVANATVVYWRHAAAGLRRAVQDRLGSLPRTMPTAATRDAIGAWIVPSGAPLVVVASAPGFVGSAVEVPPGVGDIEILVRSGIRLPIRVLDADSGDGLPATVTLSDWDLGGTRASGRFTTDSQGFVVVCAPASKNGFLGVRAEAPTYEPEYVFVAVEDPMHETVVRLRRGKVFLVRVVNADNSPSGGSVFEAEGATVARTDSTGSVAFTWRLGAPLQVRGANAECTIFTPDEGVAAASARGEETLVKLRKSMLVRGVVVDEVFGMPIEGALVELRGSLRLEGSRSAGLTTSQFVISNGEGAFTFDPLGGDVAHSRVEIYGTARNGDVGSVFVGGFDTQQVLRVGGTQRSVKVIVTNEVGSAVPDAFVQAIWSPVDYSKSGGGPEPFVNSESRTIRGESSGAYGDLTLRLPGVSGGWRVDCCAPGYLRARMWIPADDNGGAPLRVVLESAVRFVGRVSGQQGNPRMLIEAFASREAAEPSATVPVMPGGAFVVTVPGRDVSSEVFLRINGPSDAVNDLTGRVVSSPEGILVGWLPPVPLSDGVGGSRSK